MQEAALRQPRRGVEEELLDPRLAVGQAVAEEGEVGGEARIRPAPDGASPGRARCRSARSAARRTPHRPRRPAARRHRSARGRARAGRGAAGGPARRRRARQASPARRRPRRRGSPPGATPATTPSSNSSSKTPTPLAFTTTSARGRLGEHGAQPRLRRRVDAHLGPVRRLDVAVLLPVEGVGLVEGDAVAARREVAEQAAVIGRGAVPVGGQQARSVERDPHSATSRSC